MDITQEDRNAAYRVCKTQMEASLLSIINGDSDNQEIVKAFAQYREELFSNMQVLLPPAANVPEEYLEGWIDGQNYLKLIYGKTNESL